MNKLKDGKEYEDYVLNIIKDNKKLYNNNKNWLIILDKNSMTDVNDLYNKPKKYIKKLSKKSPKKSS